MPLPFPFDHTARPLISFEHLSVSAYDLVLCPGGYEAPDRIRQDHFVKVFVKGMHDAGKMVAGIDHGIWIMISAGIMGGRMACAEGGIKDDLLYAGARITQREVVVDGTLITCGSSLWVETWVRTALEMVVHHTTGELVALAPHLGTTLHDGSVPKLRQRSFEDGGSDVGTVCAAEKDVSELRTQETNTLCWLFLPKPSVC